MLNWDNIDKSWEDYDYCLSSVKSDGYALKYVKEQTEEICLEAVRRIGYAIEYIKEQSPEIVYYALEQNPDLDPDIIKITKEQWLEFKQQRPELFI